MVFLILTRSGFEDARPRINAAGDAVWVNAGVLSEPEVVDLRKSGWNLTTFARPPDLTDIACDIDTIREHHPGHVIWAEVVAR